MTAATAMPGGRIRTQIDAVGWLTFYIILLFFIPSRLYLGPLGSAGSPSMLFGLASLLIWFLLLLGRFRSTPGTPQPIRIALAAFLFSAGVSYVLAVAQPMSPDETSPADVALLALAAWSGTLLLTHDAVQERGRLDTLVWRLAVCGGLIAALGIVQILTRQLWVDQIVLPGLTSSPAYTLGSRGGFPRPAGTAIHPIEYGVILAMMLPIALHVGLHHTHRGPFVRWLPAAAVAAIIPLTSSRSAYLGAVVALAIYVVGWTGPQRLRLLGLTAAGLLAMSVITPNFLNSVIGLFAGAGEDPSVVSRADSFSLAFEFIASDPLFGRGLGTFLPKYRIFDNQYLLLLVTIGVVGTTAFLALGATAFFTVLRVRGRVRDGATRDIALALAASIAAGFTCLFMFDAFAFPMTMGTLFLIMGIGGALRRIESTRSGLTALLQ